MIYTENYSGCKKPCLALASVGGGLGWDLSGDVMTGEMVKVGPHKMWSFQCSVWKHFIIRSEKSIWDENNHPGHQITVITLSARAPELSVSGCSSSQRFCWYFHLYGHFVSDNSSYSSWVRHVQVQDLTFENVPNCHYYEPMMVTMVWVWCWGHVPVPVRCRAPSPVIMYSCGHPPTSHTVTAVTSQGRLLQTNVLLNQSWPCRNDKLLVCSGTNCVFGTFAFAFSRSIRSSFSYNSPIPLLLVDTLVTR